MASTWKIKQPFSLLLLRLSGYNFGCVRNKTGEITKFRPINPVKKINISKITRFCRPNTGKIISRTTNFVEKSFIPVRLQPEGSIYQPSYKTKLHSSIHTFTKTSETLTPNFTPYSPYLGNFRWFANIRYSGHTKKGDVEAGKESMDKMRSRTKEFDGVFYKSMKTSLNEYRAILIEKAKRDKFKPRKP